ncbi:M protein [Entamoeba marina]
MVLLVPFILFCCTTSALISNPGHTSIMASNLETTERDVVELEKRILINEDRERTLQTQLEMHHRDLHLAANPTVRVQLERGIESIHKELRVLRAAKNKFLDKMRNISDGLRGKERNSFIRRHRLEKRVGSTNDIELKKVQKETKKVIKNVAKEAAKKYGKQAAKQAGKIAKKEAIKTFGDDKDKVKQEVKKAKKSTYKSAYKEIMKQVKHSATIMNSKNLKEKAASIVVDMNKNVVVKPTMNKKVAKQNIKKVVDESLGKKTTKTPKIEKKIKKTEEEKKSQQKIKDIKKVIEKQKDKALKMKIQQKVDEKNEKKQQKKLIPSKPSLPKVNPVHKTKRAIEKTVYLAQQRAKADGIKALPVQHVPNKQVPDQFSKFPTVGELEQQKQKEEQEHQPNRSPFQQQMFEPEFPQHFLRPNPFGMNAQRQYLGSLLGGDADSFDSNMFYAPADVEEQYREMLM